jgi:hypothetical protein
MMRALEKSKGRSKRRVPIRQELGVCESFKWLKDSTSEAGQCRNSHLWKLYYATKHYTRTYNSRNVRNNNIMNEWNFTILIIHAVHVWNLWMVWYIKIRIYMSTAFYYSVEQSSTSRCENMVGAEQANEHLLESK